MANVFEQAGKIGETALNTGKTAVENFGEGISALPKAVAAGAGGFVDLLSFWIASWITLARISFKAFLVYSNDLIALIQKAKQTDKNMTRIFEEGITDLKQEAKKLDNN